MVTPLGKAIEFFRDFGLFDVVLPFLLVFTIVFAILEKTRILGTSKVGDKDLPNKNLNAMIAFVFGLLVVATANVVRAINESLPNIIILVVAAVSYLIMIGVFFKTDELDFSTKHKGWYRAFMIIMFIGVVAIFLNSIYDSGGNSFLEIIGFFIITNWDTAIITSVLFLGIMLLAMWYITHDKKDKKKESA
ncbi:MAG: hypothetical protein AABW56_02175 [Nanoarchaeota archaeon]